MPPRPASADGAPPPAPRVAERVLELGRAAGRYDLVIGTFGSIYKGKASMRLLDVCSHLNARGVQTLLVFVGSYMRSLDDYEGEFVQPSGKEVSRTT
jgi:hypothetical protein